MRDSQCPFPSASKNVSDPRRWATTTAGGSAAGCRPCGSRVGMMVLVQRSSWSPTWLTIATGGGGTHKTQRRQLPPSSCARPSCLPFNVPPAVVHGRLVGIAQSQKTYTISQHAGTPTAQGGTASRPQWHGRAAVPTRSSCWRGRCGVGSLLLRALNFGCALRGPRWVAACDKWRVSVAACLCSACCRCSD